MSHKKFWRVGDKELAYIKEAIDGGLHGEFNKRLELDFAKKLGVQFAIAVNSGNSALHCALFASGVGPGDEVIVPPLTFASPTFATIALGAIPVFADIDPNTFTINPQEIEKRITSKTKAIVPVSLYGLPSDITPIMEIAKKHNLKVVEDNAECLMGTYHGHIAGTLADMSIFSFERSKHMTTQSGGMIITNNEALAAKARKFSILGYTTLSARQDAFKADIDRAQHPTFKRHEMMGFNYRLPEVCAAMGVAQLEKIDTLIDMRKKIAALYQEAVKGCDWIMPQKNPEGFVNSYWTYVFAINTTKVSWETFREKFLTLGGERFYGAWSINYLEPFLEGKSLGTVTYQRGLCPVAEELQPRLVQLKTNFGDLEYAKKQAEILHQTIMELT